MSRLSACAAERRAGPAARGCRPQRVPPPAVAARGPAESADQFVARINRELTVLSQEVQAAGYTQDTFITVDTQLLNARSNDRYLGYLSRAVAELQALRRPAARRPPPRAPS